MNGHSCHQMMEVNFNFHWVRWFINLDLGSLCSVLSIKWGNIKGSSRVRVFGWGCCGVGEAGNVWISFYIDCVNKLIFKWLMVCRCSLLHRDVFWCPIDCYNMACLIYLFGLHFIYWWKEVVWDFIYFSICTL